MESTNGKDPTTNGNGASTGASKDSIESYAAKTANPQLFLHKYWFYINTLGLSDAEAKVWADADVSINTDARREFNLPPAKPQHQNLA